MKKFYQKSEPGFVASVIAVYAVALIVCYGLLEKQSLFSMWIVWVLAAFITWFVGYNGLKNKYGFIKAPIKKVYLFYIPMIPVCTVNLWFGFSLNYSIFGQIMAVLTVGMFAYIEEVIFRGMLFRLLEKKNLYLAIAVSSILFGIDCIFDYIDGDVLTASLKLVAALAIGFAVTMIYVRSNSLIPGIIIHCAYSILSTFKSVNFGGDNSLMWNVITTVVVVICAAGYGVFLLLRKPEENPYYVKEVVNDKGIKYVQYSKKTKNAGKSAYQKRR